MRKEIEINGCIEIPPEITEIQIAYPTAPLRHGGGEYFSFSSVFSPGGQTAADVALGFVQVQQLPHLAIQCRIHLRQPLGNVFM